MTPTANGAGRARIMWALMAVWLVWGSTYLAIKIGLETLDPFVMQAVRFVFASALMLAILWRKGYGRPTAVEVRNAAMVGIMLLIGGLGLVTLAEDRGVDTGLVATIIAIQPLLMSLWGGVWREWPSRIELMGMVVGLGGVAVLMSDRGLSGSGGGVLLVFAASASWSLGSAVSRRIRMPDGLTASGIEMGAAAIGYTVLALVTGEGFTTPSLRSGLAVAYLVVFGSIVGFTAFTFLIMNVPASLAMSYAYVNPAIAVMLGVVLSDESVSGRMAVAIPVILIGVAIVTNASRIRSPAPERTL